MLGDLATHAYSLYLNIAPLQARIDDLKSLLVLLNHPFHIIDITETKILDGKEPLIKIDIDGYVFENTPTKQVLVVQVYIFGLIWTLKNAKIYQNLLKL